MGDDDNNNNIRISCTLIWLIRIMHMIAVMLICNSYNVPATSFFCVMSMTLTITELNSIETAELQNCS